MYFLKLCTVLKIFTHLNANHICPVFTAYTYSKIPHAMQLTCDIIKLDFNTLQSKRRNSLNY